MSLTLYFHPLSSYCHKALIALYENDTAFTPHAVNLQDAAENAAFKKVWPIGKFPVLRDEAKSRTVPESTVIIDYLAQHYPGRTALIPPDPSEAFDVREIDRFYDNYVHAPMQKIIGDRLRPDDRKDAFGVDEAHDRMTVALGLLETAMATRPWAAGDAFTLADCAAAPPLFYRDFAIKPLAGEYPALDAYLGRLKARPSYARVLKEAEPFLQYVPR